MEGHFKARRLESRLHCQRCSGIQAGWRDATQPDARLDSAFSKGASGRGLSGPRGRCHSLKTWLEIMGYGLVRTRDAWTGVSTYSLGGGAGLDDQGEKEQTYGVYYCDLAGVDRNKYTQTSSHTKPGIITWSS